MQKNTIFNIKDISDDFKDFEASFEGTNYILSIVAKSFDFNCSEQFSVELLRKLFPQNKNFNGIITLINELYFDALLNEYFQYASDDEGVFVSGKMMKIVSDEILNKRKKIFKEIIGRYISFSSACIFEYEPFNSTYLKDYVMWGLYLVILNEKNGIFLALRTWD